MQIIPDYLLNNIKPIFFYLLATFVFALWKLDKRKTDNKLLLAVLVTMLLTEIVCLLFEVYNYSGGTSVVYSFSMPLHNLLWLYILYRNINMKLLTKFLGIMYLIFSAATNLFQESLSKFNGYLMIVGAFIYLVLFIIESFYELQKENFSFFSSHNFILLFSPIMLFLGFSIGFGFQSTDLLEQEVFGINLYDFISHFVSVVYYSLINVYIYKENSVKSGG